MQIVMTGTFRVAGIHLTRKALIDQLQKDGHEVDSKVRPSTDLLVVGDTGKHGETRKLREAKQHGVRVVSPTEFLNELRSDDVIE